MKELIEILAGTHGQAKTMFFDATVVSAVNEDTRTVDVDMVSGGTSNRISVRLMAAIDDGLLYYPENGSNVVVLMSEHVEPVIIQYSGIDKIVFLGGKYAGIPIVVDPDDSSKGVLKRLNLIENDINNLKQVFNNWIVSAGDGGAALYAAAASWKSASLNVTSQNQIEHQKIKQ